MKLLVSKQYLKCIFCLKGNTALSITKISSLKLPREIIAVCSENHANSISKAQSYWKVNQVVQTVTAVS